MEYQTNPKILRQGWTNENEVTLQVDVTSGTVELQIEDAGNAFYTPAEPDFTISVSGSYVLPRLNRPRTQVIATGDAEFKIIGGEFDEQ